VSWWRATLLGVVLVAIAFGLLVMVPQYLVAEISGVERSTRVALATGWFTIALTAMLFGLRKLQARGLTK
jgi:hypothetical protein